MRIEKIFKPILKNYDPIETAAVFSSLTLIPQYQTKQFSLEKLIGLCISLCSGSKPPTVDLVTRLLEKASKAGFQIMEDPAEDVFIDSLWFDGKKYKVATGLWEGGIYQTQTYLQLVEERVKADKRFTEKIKTILEISDELISRGSLEVGELGYPSKLKTIQKKDYLNIRECINRVTIPQKPTAIPSLQEDKFQNIYKQELGNSDLEEAPFIRRQDRTICLLPSSVITCLKRLILSYLQSEYPVTTCDDLISYQLLQRINALKIYGKFEGLPVVFRTLPVSAKYRIAESIIEFDRNYFFHFIFIYQSCGKLHNDWFAGIDKPSDSVSSYLDDRINHARRGMLSHKERGQGCSIIVLCGHGQGIGLNFRFSDKDNWRILATNIHDLDTISKDKDCTPHKIWRLTESESKLRKLGLTLINYNGFLNLYGFSKQNDYGIIQHKDFVDAQHENSSIVLAIPNNCQLDIRQKAITDNEVFILHHPEVGDIGVSKGYPESIFSVNERESIYVPSNFDPECFRAVFFDKTLSLWIESTVSPSMDIDLQCRLFEALLAWVNKFFIKIGPVNAEKLHKHIKLWRLSLNIRDDWQKIRPTPSYQALSKCYQNRYKGEVLETSFPSILIDGLRSEYNYTERAMLRALAEYSSKYIDVNTDQIIDQVFCNYDARYVHAFVAKEYSEYFLTEKQEPISVERIDEQNIKIDMGWQVRNRAEGNTLKGKAQCGKYLDELINYLVAKINSLLLIYNRDQLLTLLLENIEIADTQKKRWKRTIKANKALQKDYEELLDVVNQHLGELNAASLTSRLVVEMALCECPEEHGERPGIIEVQELLCLASMIHHLGGLREAIYYDAVEPTIIISNFGDVMFDQSFMEEVVQNYARQLNEDILKENEINYKENLTEAVVTNEKFRLDETFEFAWEQEFGFSIEAPIELLNGLRDLGIHKEQLVYKADLEEICEACQTLTSDQVNKMLIALSVHPRSSWEEIPEPYKPSDAYPWKFRRRFSLSCKPIIKLTNNSYLVSPKLITKCFFYFLRICFRAELDDQHFRTKPMRKWIGAKRKQAGLTFNSEVNIKLQELGWSTLEEKGLPELLQLKIEQDLGDVDVLAWSTRLRKVLAIECKDLQLAKTQGEIAGQIQDFRGVSTNKNGKQKNDRLLKHVLRVQKLNEHKDRLGKKLGMNETYSLEAYVVFSNTVPMTFSSSRKFIEEVDFISYEELYKLDTKTKEPDLTE
ncbi:hypothetical protein [Neptuniibacter caesariensis]|uniref:hypothetical protein n=1 Tax=Neptuniibacter caesariensis TaxID=207954 RepID=UPI0012B688D8|nr:hypothetical protein [Neptuniibacter caesariensis]